MDAGEDIEVEQGAHAASPLVLRSRHGRFGAIALLAFGPAVGGLVGYWAREVYGFADWIWFVGCGVAALILLALSLWPVELRADEAGIHWRGLARRRTYLWPDIEAVGISSDRTVQGYDASLTRRVVPRRPRRTPMLGLNLKIGARNTATVAYRRGFTGFEVNLPNEFDLSLIELVAELQSRLERSGLDHLSEPA